MGLRIRYLLEAALVRAAESLVRALPERVWGPLAAVLGAMAFAALRRRRRVALENLRACCPGRAERELRELARHSFQQLARTLIEVLAGALEPGARPLSRVDLKGLEVLEEAVSEGRGVVLVASHLGNWELLGAATAQLGYRHLVVSKRLKNPWVSDWIRRRRERAGMEVLWSDEGASVRLMERLEAKGLVSIVTDQDPRSRGVQARFLGRPTRAHRGAATLALAADCPVVLATIVRLGNGRRHQIEYSRIDPPSPAGRMEADVAALTQAALDRLSRKILEHPSEYLWAHDRFKEARRPA